jgi:predicted nucleotidyltransferase
MMTRAMDALAFDRIARKHGVAMLLQFGSSVTGKLHPRSDVDIGVLLDRPRLSLDEDADLRHDLQALFPGHEVDVAFLDHTDALFLKKVMETCRLLSGDPRRLQRLRIYAFRRYQDHRRFLDMERAFVARRLGARSA